MMLAKLLFADVASPGLVALAADLAAPAEPVFDSIDDVPAWMLDTPEPAPWVYNGPSDEAITAAWEEAKALYDECLADLHAEAEVECEVADLELGGNAFHQVWVMATEAIAVAAGELEKLDLNRLTADLLQQPEGAFDPVEYLKAATHFLESSEQELEIASARFSVAPSQDVAGSHQRRLLACRACWPWELGHRECWCDCGNDGSEDDGCNPLCPCKSGLTCDAGSHRCRAKGNVGDSCHTTRPCASGLSCQPGAWKCYHHPREEDEPCSMGFGCQAGLNCEAGSQKCRRPSGLGEPCHTTRPCVDGYYCNWFLGHECWPMGVGFKGAKRCAYEGQRCQCSGVVVYGRRYKPSVMSELAYKAMLEWPVARKQVANAVDCANGVFGDPIRGHWKQCWCVE